MPPEEKIDRTVRAAQVARLFAQLAEERPAVLDALLRRFGGGPVGVDNLAAAIGEERDTIEDVLEPYLIQQGFLQRTPRGRIATLAAYRHLGVAVPQRESGLFGE